MLTLKSTRGVSAQDGEISGKLIAEQDKAYLTLEICRGKTRFPNRPVCQPRFLIGSGTGCDLRLGGGEMPPLHTIIVVAENEVRVEAIASQPPLQVNQRIVESTSLAEGDQLQIGPFQFMVHLGQPLVAQTQDSLNRSDRASVPIANQVMYEDDQPLMLETSALSAAELVELIEAEEASVADFERKLSTGRDALLHAIESRRMATASSPAESLIADASAQSSDGTVRHAIHGAHELLGPRGRSPAQSDAAFLLEMERVHWELEQFSHELERRLTRVSQREACYDEAATQLAEAQLKLASRLETLLQQIELQRNTDPPRAIA